MKKTLLSLAILAAAFSAHAVTQPAKSAASAPAGAPAPIATAAAAAAEKPTVTVSGATTVAGAPLLLSVDGEKAVEPSFQQLFDASQSHKAWKVTKVQTGKTGKSRLYMTSVGGKSTIEMDVSSTLASNLDVKKDSLVSIEGQSAGGGSLIKFVKNGTPLGFMVNQSTSVQQLKK